MIGRLEQFLGIVLILIILLDIFLTVLYARIGTSIVGYRVGRLIWASFVTASKAFGPRRGTVLSFCGPVILVLLVGVWALGLTLGAALVMHPELGTSIRATNGDTPTDFVTAMYAGGTSMAIVGASDFTPHTSSTRLLFLLNSLIGVSVMSLTLTYLLQVYTALQRRNVLALSIHFLSGCTGDAAELLARLGPQGQFSGGYTNLSELGVEMTHAKEAHHFYPVLFYFRFTDPYHSVSRSTLVALDTVSLIKSALDDQKYRWLMETGAVAQLWEASMMLLITLVNTFLPRGAPSDGGAQPDQQTRDRWLARYRAALHRLQQAGLQTTGDEKAGAEAYLSYRAQWDHHISKLAPSMAYSMEEIDPAISGLESKGGPNDSLSRLHVTE
ncbi:two pore domain potassium channel family protein [Pseudaminobacter sp. 19-2017]|uniref:Two pore domain potassium channel family protein n=1 Tax=Pseudaminobacter soli (ex Zhang et al. 2022) TaxID=2831468 RepID=A0A942I404_9HYPH|nr:two pore domain potassium channel family protein [Pseudaminobacter soli]MBS3652097.1 two pore domain potassium channel family protein [Pseudaminobacter soli]